MKILTFKIYLILFSIQLCFGQILPPPTLPTNWNRIYIKDVGYFDLPPTMEVQKGKYKEYVDEFKKIHGFNTSQLTAQQKGLNDLDNKNTVEKYARVMLQTSFGYPGDFEKINFNISTVTKTDIDELNIILKKQLEEEFNQSPSLGLKLIEWYPLKIEKINGMSCIHVSYKRQVNNKPFVLVHNYTFFNYDRKHSLTLSYRISEANYWEKDFHTIIKSFRITNIK